MSKRHIDTGTTLWSIIAADKVWSPMPNAALGKRLRTARSEMKTKETYFYFVVK